MSHYSNCCWTPVPLPRSLFQFLLSPLVAPSPLSPSTLPLCPAPNKSSLISYQPTLLTPCHSLYLLKCICHMDKPLCIVGESSSPGPFPSLFPQTSSAPPTWMCCCCLAKIPNLSLSPCCHWNHFDLGGSPLPAGGWRQTQLVAHTKVERVLGSCSFEIISHQRFQEFGFIYLLKHQCALLSQGPGYKLSTC